MCHFYNINKSSQVELFWIFEIFIIKSAIRETSACLIFVRYIENFPGEPKNRKKMFNRK